MTNSRGVSSILILLIIFILIIVLLFVFNFITLPPEFYSAFAGALVAIVFSALISFYFWRKQQKLGKDTKAQIIQTLLSEIELNMNNIANFIKGCKEGIYFTPFKTATIQRTLFWPRFLTDYPHPSFELTQHFDLLYSSFLLMEYYGTEVEISLPENLRYVPETASLSPEDQQTIKTTSSGHFGKWRLNAKSTIEFYNKIMEFLSNEFNEYEFKKQLYFENNEAYEKLRRFYTEI